MRAILTAATLSLLLAPVVSASGGPLVDYYADPEVTVSPAGCDLCVDAGLDAGTNPTPNCDDCASYAVESGAHVGTDGVGADASVCYSAFFYVCFVDEDVFLPPPQ